MLSRILYLIVFIFVFQTSTNGQVAVGQWRDHLPYKKTVDVTEGPDYYYCATYYAVFSLSKADGLLERLTKINALSDIGISTIRFNNYNNTLVVGYQNGNLDLISDNTTYNLSDIKRSTNITGDKSINNIYFIGKNAYLSTGFGIVVINTDKNEVVDTYSITSTLSQLSVNDITTDNNYIYAATSVGLYYADVNSSFLADFNQWTLLSNFVNSTVSNGQISHVVNFNDTIYVCYDNPLYQSDTVYYGSINGWQRFNAENSYETLDMEVNQNLLIITHSGNVQQFDASRNSIKDIFSINGNELLSCSQAILSPDGYTTIATNDHGLVRSWNSWQAYIYIPAGPPTNSVYAMDTGGDQLWVATGGVLGPWNNAWKADGVFSFKDETWDYYDMNTDSLFLTADSVHDYLAIAVDPENSEHVLVGTWRGGVIEILNDQIINRYTIGNSSLQEWDAQTVTWVGVAGIDFDSRGNMWCSNSWASNPISVLKPDGSWKAMGLNTDISNVISGQVLITASDLIWILKPFLSSGGGIQVYDYNGTEDDVSDDQWIFLDNNIGTGNLPSATLYCMAEDHNGEIWVGTSQGIAVFYAPDNVFSGSNYDAQQVLLEQDGNIQILLETEAVTAIAVDGADRKWMGTKNSGVFLMSAEGTKEINHFTTENSPLLSNEITSIAINPKTGEVYFGTAEGIISYRGTATDGSDNYTGITAFPNPVREDYNGLISVKGLMENSEVKITDVSGDLVYTTTSNGGQATWNGLDLFGNRVKSGVYLVFATNDTGDLAEVTKILIMGQ